LNGPLRDVTKISKTISLTLIVIEEGTSLEFKIEEDSKNLFDRTHVPKYKVENVYSSCFPYLLMF
jgi:hypothetical protein